MHHVEQLKCLLSSTFIAQTLEKCAVVDDISRAAKLRHSPEQYVHGLTHPLCFTQTIEELINDYGIHPKSLIKNEAKGGETKIQAADATEAADGDGVGVQIRGYPAGWGRHGPSG
jgi:hypothetical protein